MSVAAKKNTKYFSKRKKATKHLFSSKSPLNRYQPAMEVLINIFCESTYSEKSEGKSKNWREAESKGPVAVIL